MRLLALALAMSFTAAAQPPAKIKIVLVGDSTVNDEGGWGPGFRARFSPAVGIINLARNGRSSKSFRDEGAWQPALDAKPDYILIQFGHNDSPGKGPERETNPATTFRANLVRYIAEARAVGAQPVLVTSIVRRVFTPEGKIRPDSLVPYVSATRAVAEQQNVPLLDLYALTKEQNEALGPEGARALHAVTKDGKPDTTHLGPAGRDQTGALAAQALARAVPSMAPYLLPAR